jgi:hypothetical protein
MKGLKCICGKTAKEAKLRFHGHDITGWKCSCGEEYHNPEAVEKILLENKLKRTTYRLKLNKVRSNLILRIPKEIGDLLELKDGGEVNVALQDGKIIVAK